MIVSAAAAQATTTKFSLGARQQRILDTLMDRTFSQHLAVAQAASPEAEMNLLIRVAGRATLAERRAAAQARVDALEETLE